MPSPSDSPDRQSLAPKGTARAIRQFFARDSRENLWALLDFLDARPALKKALLIGLPALVIAVGFGAWGYQHWARTNAVRIVRQWLDAGRLDQAGKAVQDALAS